MCCQLALPWTQAPIHHPPLGGCNGDLICFICPWSLSHSPVSPTCWGAARPKEKWMTRKTQDKPEGPLIRTEPSSARPVGTFSLCASNFFLPTPLPPLHFFSPFMTQLRAHRWGGLEWRMEDLLFLCLSGADYCPFPLSARFPPPPTYSFYKPDF